MAISRPSPFPLNDSSLKLLAASILCLITSVHCSHTREYMVFMFSLRYVQCPPSFPKCKAVSYLRYWLDQLTLLGPARKDFWWPMSCHFCTWSCSWCMQISPRWLSRRCLIVLCPSSCRHAPWDLPSSLQTWAVSLQPLLGLLTLTSERASGFTCFLRFNPGTLSAIVNPDGSMLFSLWFFF